MRYKTPEVFIGSKSRLFFPTAKRLYGATLFVEPNEYDDYFNLYGETFNVIKLEKNNGGFAFLLNSMLKYAKENNIKEYFFADDDILGFGFRDKSSNLLKEMEKMKEIAKQGYSQVMMSFSGHNWYCQEELKEKIGAWCFILNQTDDLIKAGGYDEEIPIYNDWDISANLIKHGFKTACYYGAFFNHKMASGKGGAEYLYKKQETLDKAALLLTKKYGNVLRTKKAHNQLEIRFDWRKL
jgi:hypothetical protein